MELVMGPDHLLSQSDILQDILNFKRYIEQLAINIFDGLDSFRVVFISDIEMRVPEYVTGMRCIEKDDIHALYERFMHRDALTNCAAIIQWTEHDDDTRTDKYNNACLCINEDMLFLHYIIDKDTIIEYYTEIIKHERGHNMAASSLEDIDSIDGDRWEEIADLYGNVDTVKSNMIHSDITKAVRELNSFDLLLSIYDHTNMHVIRGRHYIDNIMLGEYCPMPLSTIVYLDRKSNPIIDLGRLLYSCAISTGDLNMYSIHTMCEFHRLSNRITY